MVCALRPHQWDAARAAAWGGRVSDVVVEKTDGGLTFRDPENAKAFIFVEDVDDLRDLET